LKWTFTHSYVDPTMFSFSTFHIKAHYGGYLVRNELLSLLKKAVFKTARV